MNLTDNNESVNVIIADDHPIFRLGLMKIIKSVPAIKHMAEASNGIEVLAHLKQKQYQVIFMDYSMPEMDGEAATRIVMESYPDMRIIALSMFDDTATKRRMLEAGCKKFITKDAMEEEITTTIMDVLSGKK